MPDRSLHAVPPPDREPKSRDELKKRGGELVTSAKRSALEAMRVNLLPEVLKRGTVSVGDVTRWRAHARQAIAAWQKVDRLTSELIEEIDVAQRARNQEGN